MKIKNSLKKIILKKSLRIFSSISDENIVRLAYLVEQFTPQVYKSTVRSIGNLYEKKHPALALTKRFFTDTNENCQEKFIENLILTGFLENYEKREEWKTTYGAVPLYMPLISPTMRCNLRCPGCYAQNYKKEEDLDFEILDRIITESKETGTTALFTILGGEPFLRDDLFEIYKKHSDAYFQVYTNGTLINEKIAQKLAEAGNVLPQLSVEGLEKETDERRGKGTFKKVMEAMDILREKGVLFGCSVCVASNNVEAVTSDDFVDLMVKKGVFMGWYFLYMPVCGDKNIRLMPMPEQRNYLRIRRNYIRATKPFFIIDFTNDAPRLGGCIAAKWYCHITNFGDVEPCIFTHFAQTNVKNTSLKEAVNCQFFKEIRARQPYNSNLLMPCMLTDKPEVIRELNAICKLRPTHPGAQTLIEDLKDDLDKYSHDVHQVFDKIWEEENSKIEVSGVEATKAGVGDYTDYFKRKSV